ncbi:transglutaminase domain-containing protein [Candidatus Alkanophaga liquidiphilum]|nr:Transglutaminase-like enzyme [Candidatus Alkanophaga liquidiphilum]RLG38664.1 MAG: hypothetical protein DRN91_01940 [Candidatus Alkanophagales archaeon]
MATKEFKVPEIPEVPWEVPKDPELQPFLAPTPLCEAHHPRIKEEALKITEGARNPREAAMMIFYYMIDKIKFEMEPPKSALETLEEGGGNCFNKASLQIALLRSIGIPARYSLDKTKIKLIRVVIPEEIFKEMAKKQSWTIHFSVDAYIDRKWIQCDTSFDQALVPFPYNWNGRTDLLLLCPWWRLGHIGKTPVLPADEINARFAERGFTKEFCMKNIRPYMEALREMSTVELCKYYKRILGRRDAESFAHLLFFHFVGHYRDIKYMPFFRHDIDWDSSQLVFKEPKYSVDIEKRSVSGLPFEVEY